MKRLISIFTTLSLLLALYAGHSTTPAQQSNTGRDHFKSRRNFKTHPKAVIGSTPERRAAWEKLSPEQQAKVLEKFSTIIQEAKAKAAKEKRGQKPEVIETELAFTDKDGKRQIVKGKEREASRSPADSQTSESLRCFDCEPCIECEPDPCLNNPSLCEPDPCLSNPSLCQPDPTPTPTPVPTPTPIPTPTGADADGDGLPESFENTVADAFTPFYHVSTGEQPGTGFARFGDFVPQTIQQVFNPIPPISHFRVKPVGFRSDAYGNQWGFLQLDYLTLWNRDDGLAIGGFCEANLSIALGLAGYSFSQLLPVLTNHTLDNERSAVLVAAPVSGYNTYNLDPMAYYAYRYFTAAHEDTFTDQSQLFSPSQPVPAGWHIELAFSRSKHGTYPFNPDYLPLVPWYVIYSTYATLDFLYYNYYISDYEYFAYLYIADSAFYTCAVERFGDQGGTYAGTRINVGEPSNPINGSNFIRDTELSTKLMKQFVF